MSWKKKGIIIEPRSDIWWMKSHAMLPTVKFIKNNSFRVFYSGRDDNGVSHIGYSNIEVKGDTIVELSKSQNPVLSPGDRGCFDDNGVTPSCIVGDKFYYIGWNSGTTTYRMSLIMGLAFVNKSLKLERYSRAPLMKRTDREPFGICTAPYVIKDHNIYKMWYVSGEKWITKDLPVYNIKYATSKDGVNWQRDGVISLELKKNETALARPFVIKNDKYYEMYFSYKDPKLGYRIGYAVSKNGIKFERVSNSKNSLSVSANGWDSEMVEYSYIFSHNNIKFMLYNGNEYGKNGIGYAVKV